jgi:hypothetical protein
MAPDDKPKMPVSAVAWLANLVFVAIPVAVCLMAMWFVVRPPKSGWDVLVESHKIILVAAVTLSGVTLIEGFLLAAKLGTKNVESLRIFVLGGLFLLMALALAVTFFLSVLVYEAYRHVGPDEDSFGFILQFIIGLWLLIVPIIIALKFKYLEPPEQGGGDAGRMDAEFAS